MKINATYNGGIKIEKKTGLNYQKYAFLEKFGFLKQGLILGYPDGRKINPQDIPKLISKVTEISQEKFALIIPRQVHQAEIKVFKEKFEKEELNPEVDALLTNQEDLYLVVQVADCLPVFLVDHRTGLIGLAHMGWRGALLGIAEKLVKKAHDSFSSNPKDLNLVFGPSIGKCCYEISDSLAVLMDGRYIKKRGTEKYLDLKGYVKDIFLKSGIKPENIFVFEECTCCGGKLYQSYRRDKEKAGRMIAFIGKVRNN